MLKAAPGAILVAFPWPSGCSFTSRQRKVRFEGMILLGNIDRGKLCVHSRGQRLKLRASLDTNPEDLSSSSLREKAIGTKSDIKMFAGNCVQCSFNLFNLRLGLLADELQCDVQRFRPNPTDVRRKISNAGDELNNARADVVIDVQSDEEAHDTFFTLIFCVPCPERVSTQTTGCDGDLPENCARSLQSHYRWPKRGTPSPPACEVCPRPDRRLQ